MICFFILFGVDWETGKSENFEIRQAGREYGMCKQI